MYREYMVKPPETLTEFETIFKRLRSGERGIYAFGAYAGGALVGFAQGAIHPATNLRGDYCYLQDLFVRADHRGQGIARRLIEHVVAHARSLGAARVYWNTRFNNLTAQQLYDKVATKADEVLQYRIELNHT
jgi:GNAT superfamily N-acetyltransferase